MSTEISTYVDKFFLSLRPVWGTLGVMQEQPSKTIYRMLRDARRAKGLTQSALAQQAGCTQSALSMMELGRATALSRETLQKVADILGVQLPEPENPGSPGETGLTVPGHAICPNPLCLSNRPYWIGEELFFLPTGRAGDGHYCALCGEVLIRNCPHCGAPLRTPGGCCTACGQPLLSGEGIADNLHVWSARQNETISHLF